MKSADHVLIVGASTRSAAFSALRAGLEPRCLDHFADRDLAAICPVERVSFEEGASGLEQATLRLPAGPWLYTGPLENHPDQVERISRTHRLCGNPAETLRAVRDPFRVFDVLQTARASDSQAPARVLKACRATGPGWSNPSHRAAGRSIQFLDQGTRLPHRAQLFPEIRRRPERFGPLPGRPRAIGAPGRDPPARGNSRISLCLSGEHRTLPGFGPLAIPARPAWRCPGLGIFPGRALRGRFHPPGRRALARRGQSPLHRGSWRCSNWRLGRPLLVEHFRRMRNGPGGADLLPGRPASPDGSDLKVGKAILYARHPLIAPDIPFPDDWQRDLFAVPAIADIPWPGTPIAAGEPIMTIFASGSDVAQCEARLDEMEAQWRVEWNW